MLHQFKRILINLKKFNLAMIILFIFGSAPSFSATSAQTPAPNPTEKDTHYMQMAIDLAKSNPAAPFAAVIVDNTTGKVLAKGLNDSSTNPTFHGEMVAINNCIKNHPEVDWSKTVLYTTAEPCAMCQGAIVWAKIPKVVFATSLEYLLSHGWKQINIHASEINEKSPFYEGVITGGVLSHSADALFSGVLQAKKVTDH